MNTPESQLNEIIENLRLNLQVAENRIRRLQDSEYKLESEIELLKKELSMVKDKKLINETNHTLYLKQGTILDSLLSH
jgi:chaperonin cofactor prefoldin